MSPRLTNPHFVAPKFSAADRLIDALDGKDLDATLAVARFIIAKGAWRSSMVKRFLRIHRHEKSRLMRQLGPLIPPSGGGQRYRPPRSAALRGDVDATLSGEGAPW